MPYSTARCAAPRSASRTPASESSRSAIDARREHAVELVDREFGEHGEDGGELRCDKPRARRECVPSCRIVDPSSCALIIHGLTAPNGAVSNSGMSARAGCRHRRILLDPHDPRRGFENAARLCENQSRRAAHAVRRRLAIFQILPGNVPVAACASEREEALERLAYRAARVRKCREPAASRRPRSPGKSMRSAKRCATRPPASLRSKSLRVCARRSAGKSYIERRPFGRCDPRRLQTFGVLGDHFRKMARGGASSSGAAHRQLGFSGLNRYRRLGKRRGLVCGRLGSREDSRYGKRRSDRRFAQRWLRLDAQRRRGDRTDFAPAPLQHGARLPPTLRREAAR